MQQELQGVGGEVPLRQPQVGQEAVRRCVITSRRHGLQRPSLHSSLSVSLPPVVAFFIAPLSVPPSSCHRLPSSWSSSPPSLCSSLSVSLPPVVAFFIAPPLSVPPSSCHRLPSSRSSLSPLHSSLVMSSPPFVAFFIAPPLSVPPSSCYRLPSLRSSSRHLSPFLPCRVI